ncbi:MAG: GH3 auxin-responsive promoter family protein [Coprothermobacterota bacterium]|nr:GH3 auxin-responsive promoter family protein [Coprothermobacterota bacterium]
MMIVPDAQAALGIVDAFLRPWQESLAQPAASQEKVLRSLLAVYAQTEYGAQHKAGQVGSLEEYRLSFPISTYEDYKPLIQRVMAGENQLLLNENPIGWAITRGTTQDEKKFIPMTPSDLRMRVQAGRAMMAYVAASKRFDLFRGVNLNLNFPSVVGVIQAGDRTLTYGYSSGIYVKYVSASTPIHSLPTQDDIDALGGGNTMRDWDARFQLAYQQCREQNVTLVGGVAPTALRFALFLHKNHRLYPRDLWKVQIMTLGSVPGINTHRAPALTDLYGRGVVIREIYGATEGMFGQQMDEKRAWAPNYDLFFFEVQTSSGVKMLHQMTPGETGSLVVSTPILPRYKIGDLIRAYTPPYFRCIGRDRWHTLWQYAWREIYSLNLDQI